MHTILTSDHSFKKKKLVTMFFLASFALPNFAEEPGNSNFQQGYISISLLREKEVLLSSLIMVNNQTGFFSNGGDTSYARIRCENGSRILDSMPIFRGVTIFHKVEGKELVLELARYSVSSSNAEIQALKDNECRNLAPQQRTELKQTIKLPYVKSLGEKAVVLENGYVLRYQTFPPSQ